MSRRIQRQRTRGWRMPPNAVYVGRPSLWGNPYSLDDMRAMYPEIAPADRAAAAVRLYRKEIEHFGLLSDYAWYVSGKRWDAVNRAVSASGSTSMAEYAAVALRGRDLVCWCPLAYPDGTIVPCHADVLLELANGEADRLREPDGEAV